MQGWKRSGLTGMAFAEREGFNAHTLRWWSSRLGRDEAAKVQRPAFVEVVVPQTAAICPAMIEVVVRDDVRVVVPINFDEDTLRRVLRVIEVG